MPPDRIGSESSAVLYVAVPALGSTQWPLPDIGVDKSPLPATPEALQNAEARFEEHGHIGRLLCVNARGVTRMELVQLRGLKRENLRAKKSPSAVLSARDRIVATAAETLKDHNFQEFALDAVAKRARVTRRTLYNHFLNKQELYVFIRTEALRRLMIKRTIDIPERMEIEDGVRYFIEFVHEIVGDRDNIETLQAIVRDGATQSWLRVEYIRLVRDPMSMALENFLLRHIRRGGANLRVSRSICEQLIIAIESLFVHPLASGSSAREASHDLSLQVIVAAFSSLLVAETNRGHEAGRVANSFSRNG